MISMDLEDNILGVILQANVVMPITLILTKYGSFD